MAARIEDFSDKLPLVINGFAMLSEVQQSLVLYQLLKQAPSKYAAILDKVLQCRTQGVPVKWPDFQGENEAEIDLFMSYVDKLMDVKLRPLAAAGQTSREPAAPVPRAQTSRSPKLVEAKGTQMSTSRKSIFSRARREAQQSNSSGDVSQQMESPAEKTVSFNKREAASPGDQAPKSKRMKSEEASTSRAAGPSKPVVIDDVVYPAAAFTFTPREEPKEEVTSKSKAGSKSPVKSANRKANAEPVMPCITDKTQSAPAAAERASITPGSSQETIKVQDVNGRAVMLQVSLVDMQQGAEESSSNVRSSAKGTKKRAIPKFTASTDLPPSQSAATTSAKAGQANCRFSDVVPNNIIPGLGMIQLNKDKKVEEVKGDQTVPPEKPMQRPTRRTRNK